MFGLSGWLAERFARQQLIFFSLCAYVHYSLQSL